MTVRWEDSALAELADAWLKSDGDERRLIVVAAADLDRQLEFAADVLGESRPEGRRVAFAAPLGVIFRVDDDVVSVLRV